MASQDIGREGCFHFLPDPYPAAGHIMQVFMRLCIKLVRLLTGKANHQQPAPIKGEWRGSIFLRGNRLPQPHDPSVLGLGRGIFPSSSAEVLQKQVPGWEQLTGSSLFNPHSLALIVLYTHSLYEPSKFGCHETAIPWISKSKYPSRVSLNTPAQISSLSGTLEVHHCSLLRCGQNLPEASFAPIAIWFRPTCAIGHPIVRLQNFCWHTSTGYLHPKKLEVIGV